jgi:hypothetical protein
VSRLNLNVETAAIVAANERRLRGWPVYLADEMRSTEYFALFLSRVAFFVQCREEKKLHQHDSDIQQTEDNGGFPAVSSSTAAATVKRRPLTTALTAEYCRTKYACSYSISVRAHNSRDIPGRAAGALPFAGDPVRSFV